jgi:hypothetical protein
MPILVQVSTSIGPNKLPNNNENHCLGHWLGQYISIVKTSLGQLRWANVWGPMTASAPLRPWPDDRYPATGR